MIFNNKISIILPAYNEKGNIELLVPEIIEVMSDITNNYEIIIIDDSSNDGSLEILNNLEKQHQFLKVIRLTKHSAQSAAIYAGFKESKGDIVITMDADLQNDPKDIPLMLRNFEGVDMICGIRYRRCDSLTKIISSKIANYIRRKVLKNNIIDSACGFKIFKKECLNKITFFNGIHRFLPDLFLINGFKVKQFKINHHPRLYGNSKYTTRNRIFKTAFDLLKVRKIKNIKSC